MKPRILFTFNSLVLAFVGLGVLLAPEAVVTQYGGEYGQYGSHTAQFLGGAMIGFAVLTWLARDAEESPVRHAIIMALFVNWSIAFITALIAQLSGAYDAVGWVNVGVALAFAFGFGYTQIKT